MKGIPMQTGVLRVLRGTAASWWRHKELRRTGQALRRARENVQRDLSYLKQAASLPNAHVICGAGGTFIHLGRTTVSEFRADRALSLGRSCGRTWDAVHRYPTRH